METRGHKRSAAAKVVHFPERMAPGSFVKLAKQPDDLPAFELIRCEGRRCWVRQQGLGTTGGMGGGEAQPESRVIWLIG